jgi:hypothetical protein
LKEAHDKASHADTKIKDLELCHYEATHLRNIDLYLTKEQKEELNLRLEGYSFNINTKLEKFGTTYNL